MLLVPVILVTLFMGKQVQAPDLPQTPNPYHRNFRTPHDFGFELGPQSYSSHYDHNNVPFMSQPEINPEIPSEMMQITDPSLNPTYGVNPVSQPMTQQPTSGWANPFQRPMQRRLFNPINRIILTLLGPRLMRYQLDMMVQAVMSEVIRKMIGPVLNAIAGKLIDPSNQQQQQQQQQGQNQVRPLDYFGLNSLITQQQTPTAAPAVTLVPNQMANGQIQLIIRPGGADTQQQLAPGLSLPQSLFMPATSPATTSTATGTIPLNLAIQQIPQLYSTAQLQQALNQQILQQLSGKLPAQVIPQVQQQIQAQIQDKLPTIQLQVQQHLAQQLSALQQHLGPLANSSPATGLSVQNNGAQAIFGQPVNMKPLYTGLNPTQSQQQLAHQHQQQQQVAFKNLQEAQKVSNSVENANQKPAENVAGPYYVQIKPNEVNFSGQSFVPTPSVGYTTGPEISGQGQIDAYITQFTSQNRPANEQTISADITHQMMSAQDANQFQLNQMFQQQHQHPSMIQPSSLATPQTTQMHTQPHISTTQSIDQPHMTTIPSYPTNILENSEYATPVQLSPNSNDAKSVDSHSEQKEGVTLEPSHEMSNYNNIKSIIDADQNKPSTESDQIKSANPESSQIDEAPGSQASPTIELPRQYHMEDYEPYDKSTTPETRYQTDESSNNVMKYKYAGNYNHHQSPTNHQHAQNNLAEQITEENEIQEDINGREGSHTSLPAHLKHMVQSEHDHPISGYELSAQDEFTARTRNMEMVNQNKLSNGDEAERAARWNTVLKNLDRYYGTKRRLDKAESFKVNWIWTL